MQNRDAERARVGVDVGVEGHGIEEGEGRRAQRVLRGEFEAGAEVGSCGGFVSRCTEGEESWMELYTPP